MKPIKHPAKEALLAYIEAPEAQESAAIGRHLISCRSCRQAIQQLSSVVTQLEHNLHYYPQAKSSLADEDIADWVEGKLSAGETQRLDALIHNEPAALKAALHYANHSLKMQRELTWHESSQASQSSTGTAPNRLPRNISLWQRFVQWRPPVWMTVPVTMTATACLVLVVVFSQSMFVPSVEPQLSIISYQDTPVIQFTRAAPRPGIGFFSQGSQQKRQPFDDMMIRADPQQGLHLQWTPVNNAKNYNIQLYLIEGDQRLPIGKGYSENASMVISDFQAIAGRRYAWELTGSTVDHLKFKANGGFFVNTQ